MEQYRRKLKLQNILLAVGFMILVVIQVLAYLGIVTPNSDEHWADYWNGFIAGAAAGICILFLIGFLINIRALRNETKLKKLYIKENDERSAQVQKNGKSAGATIFMIIALPAAIVSGYFNITVFLTIVACEMVLSLIICGAKLYYNRML